MWTLFMAVLGAMTWGIAEIFLLGLQTEALYVLFATALGIVLLIVAAQRPVKRLVFLATSAFLLVWFVGVLSYVLVSGWTTMPAELAQTPVLNRWAAYVIVTNMIFVTMWHVHWPLLVVALSGIAYDQRSVLRMYYEDMLADPDYLILPGLLSKFQCLVMAFVFRILEIVISCPTREKSESQVYANC